MTVLPQCTHHAPREVSSHNAAGNRPHAEREEYIHSLSGTPSVAFQNPWFDPATSAGRLPSPRTPRRAFPPYTA